MIIDDLRRAVEQAQPARPILLPSYETGEPETRYVVIMHPGWKDLLRMTAREQYYHDRWVERFNRRQTRLGLPTYPREIIGEVGSFAGTRIVEGT